jgi:hypothetical protein
VSLTRRARWQRALWLAVLALLAGAPAVPAQVVTGVVRDSVTGAGVPGAIVFAVRPGGALAGSAQADSAAAYVVVMDGPGRVQLRARHPTFATLVVDLDLVTGQRLALDLLLAREPVVIRPVIATVERDARLAGFRARALQPGSGQFLRRPDIEQRPAARVTDLLREMHGVEIVTVGSGTRPRVQLVALRGGIGRCMPALYIDGIAVRQLTESGIDDFLKPDMIEGVEVYTSVASAPHELAAPGNCGVVAFWTRPVGAVEKLTRAKLVAALISAAVLATLIVVTR